MKTPMPEAVKKLVGLDASNVEEVAAQVDFVFCAVNMKRTKSKRWKKLTPRQNALWFPTTVQTA